MLASAITIDITPPQKWIDDGRIFLMLNGGARRVEKTEHPLSARVLALKDFEGKRIVWAALDVAALHPGTAARIRNDVVSSRGLAARDVLVNVTHTHTSPVTMDFPTAEPDAREPDPEYMGYLVARVVEAIQRAVDTLQPAYVCVKRAEADIGFNRVRGGTPFYDKTLDLLWARSLDGGTLAVAIFHGTHPTSRGFSDPILSPDYPGVARDRIEEARGGTALFFQGFGGSIGPGIGDGATGFAVMTDVGGELADAALKALNSDGWVKLAGVVRTEQVITDLTLQAPPKRSQILDLQAKEKAEPDGEWPPASNWCVLMLAHYPAGAEEMGPDSGMATSLPTEMNSFVFGDAWRLVASAHEVVNEYSPLVRGLFAEPFVTLAAYSTAVQSYIATAAMVKTEPFINYEGHDMLYAYNLPSALSPLVEDEMLAGFKLLE